MSSVRASVGGIDGGASEIPAAVAVGVRGGFEAYGPQLRKTAVVGVG